METETIPEAPKILGTAKLLGVALNTKYDPRESANLVRLLVEEVIQKPYKWLLMNPEATFTEKEIHIWNAHALRLIQGEPIHYVVGKAWFCGLELRVTPDVLIPRPETEELVQWILEKVRPFSVPRIVDIGTGSGCISLALAKLLPLAKVTGVDISQSALEIAQQNASTLGLFCEFRRLDIFLAMPNSFEQLDLVVSNPPYIPTMEWETLDANVREYEPSLALKVPDAQPLIYYNKVSELARFWLKDGGHVFFEIHEQFGAAMQKLLSDLGYSKVEIRKDINGRDRMVCAQWMSGIEAS